MGIDNTKKIVNTIVMEEGNPEKTYTSQAEQDGYVEIINPDGSTGQVKKEVAQKMIDNLESLKAKAGL